jgi:hypothetical protein
VIKFAKTLCRYRYGILNHCDYPIHTGKLGVKREGEVKKGIWDEISTIFVNKPVNKREDSFFSELILLHFWLFAQIFSDKEMPAVSKRGVDGNQIGGSSFSIFILQDTHLDKINIRKLGFGYRDIKCNN